MRTKKSADSARSKYYLSSDGFTTLKTRLEEMQHQRTLNIKRLRVLKDQQSDGVTLEDSSYIQMLSTNQFLEVEIEKIRFILSNAKVSDGKRKPSDEVVIGSCVTLEGEGRQFEYTIVNSVEADPFKGKISDASPLGQQLLGKKIEDMVTLPQPAKKKPLEVRLTGIN